MKEQKPPSNWLRHVGWKGLGAAVIVILISGWFLTGTSNAPATKDSTGTTTSGQPSPNPVVGGKDEGCRNSVTALTRMRIQTECRVDSDANVIAIRYRLGRQNVVDFQEVQGAVQSQILANNPELRFRKEGLQVLSSYAAQGCALCSPANLQTALMRNLQGENYNSCMQSELEMASCLGESVNFMPGSTIDWKQMPEAYYCTAYAYGCPAPMASSASNTPSQPTNAAIAAATTSPQTVNTLIERAKAVHDDCFKPVADDRACDELDKLTAQLRQQGWCYGHKDTPQAMLTWVKCDPDDP